MTANGLTLRSATSGPRHRDPSSGGPAAARRQTRYLTLDHWRGLACLLVVVYHSALVSREHAGLAWTSGAERGLAAAIVDATRTFDVGVALFFVISGYCIAAAAETAIWRQVPISRYFVRRFRRIYPPYWIVVLCSIAFFAVDFWPWKGLLSSEPWAQLRPHCRWSRSGSSTLSLRRCAVTRQLRNAPSKRCLR